MEEKASISSRYGWLAGTLSQLILISLVSVSALLSYCRLGSSAAAAATASLVAAIAANTTTPGTTAVAAAQWSVSNANTGSASSSQVTAPAAAAVAAEVNYTSEEIPRLAEYSASMYAKTPEEHASYLQYYTQYYTTQLNTLKANNKSEAVSPPDLSKFVYDEKSAYYYDSVSNLYYDSNTQYFYKPQTRQFSYWDSEKNTFVPVASPPETSTASAAPVQDKEEKKHKPEKQDKVISIESAAFNCPCWLIFSICNR